jgi:hypothetical protein
MLQKPPHTLLEVGEVSVDVWNCTPLLGGSVRRTLTLTSFIANEARGFLHQSRFRVGYVGARGPSPLQCDLQQTELQ